MSFSYQYFIFVCFLQREKWCNIKGCVRCLSKIKRQKWFGKFILFIKKMLSSIIHANRSLSYHILSKNVFRNKSCISCMTILVWRIFVFFNFESNRNIIFLHQIFFTLCISIKKQTRKYIKQIKRKVEIMIPYNYLY